MADDTYYCDGGYVKDTYRFNGKAGSHPGADQFATESDDEDEHEKGRASGRSARKKEEPPEPDNDAMRMTIHGEGGGSPKEEGAGGPGDSGSSGSGSDSDRGGRGRKGYKDLNSSKHNPRLNVRDREKLRRDEQKDPHARLKGHYDRKGVKKSFDTDEWMIFATKPTRKPMRTVSGTYRP